MDAPAFAERISADLPHVKLIAQLRDPVERAYSDYCMLYRRGSVSRDVSLYLDPRNGGDNRFLAGGFYARQLQPYFDLFGKERIHVTTYEAIWKDPSGHVARVRRFLGLPELEYRMEMPAKVKDKTEPMLPAGLRRNLQFIKPAVAPWRQTIAFRALRSLMAREVNYAPLTPGLRARLTEYYSRDVETLSRQTGEDLSEWLRSA
jgi:hypothetical protein